MTWTRCTYTPISPSPHRVSLEPGETKRILVRPRHELIALDMAELFFFERSIGLMRRLQLTDKVFRRYDRTWDCRAESPYTLARHMHLRRRADLGYVQWSYCEVNVEDVGELPGGHRGWLETHLTEAYQELVDEVKLMREIRQIRRGTRRPTTTR